MDLLKLYIYDIWDENWFDMFKLNLKNKRNWFELYEFYLKIFLKYLELLRFKNFGFWWVLEKMI